MNIKQVLHHLNRRDTRLLPKSKLFKSLLILLLVSASFISIRSVFAETTTLADQFKAKQNAFGENKVNNENWQAESINTQLMIGINALAGSIPDTVINGNYISTSSAWIPGGLLGTSHQIIASIYDQPISGVEYIAQVKNEFLGKPAYADTGFQGLSPLIPIWKNFRNAAYIVFSLIFIVIGLMIMLRVKLNPQTVVNIQNTIPKIITSLILVTFSYAIAGLLIDISKLVEGLGISILANSGQYAGTLNIKEILADPRYLQRIWGLVPWGTVWVLAGITFVISGIFGMFGGGLTSAISGAVTGGSSVTTLNGAGGGWSGILLNGLKSASTGFLIVMLVALIFIFWYTVKLCFGLLKCYINVLISVILGPLEIALGAIPNLKIGFGSWITNLIANLAVFPIVTIFLVLIEIIKNTVANSSGMWTPAGVSGFNILALGTKGGIVVLALSLGGIMIAAKLPSLVPEIVFQLKPSGLSKAIGESTAPYSKVAKGGAMYGGSLVAGKLESFSGGANKGWRGLAGKAGSALKYATGKK